MSGFKSLRVIMKTTKNCIGVLSILFLTCTAAYAETAWVVPPTDQHLSPIQRVLRSDLAMPGVGIAASKKQLTNRLQYALEHDWLSGEQIEQLKAELKAISDQEDSQRDETGNLTFESKMLLANQIFKLNAKFENITLKEEKQRL